MTERIGIVGSRTYPVRADVVAFVSALPPGTVIVSGGAHGPDTWAVEAAKSLGLPTMIHWPDLPRYGSPAAYFHRNTKIVEDADRIVAFASKDPKTKKVTAGTTMTLSIAERAGVPTQMIETPVPAKLCDTIAKLRGRFDNVRGASTPGERSARVASASDYLTQLIAARDIYQTRLGDGWDEIDHTTDDTEKERLESIWLRWLSVYQTVSDVINEAEHVFNT